MTRRRHLNPELQAEVDGLQGSMDAAAKARGALPERFTVREDGNRVWMRDAETGREVDVPLFAYGEVRRVLGAFLGKEEDRGPYNPPTLHHMKRVLRVPAVKRVEQSVDRLHSIAVFVGDTRMEVVLASGIVRTFEWNERERNAERRWALQYAAIGASFVGLNMHERLKYFVDLDGNLMAREVR